MQPSSQDLHPSTGARFVFEREDDGPDGHRYCVTIYLPGDLSWAGQLSWVAGVATLVPADGQPADTQVTIAGEPLAWAHAEALKLARTLRRTPKQHMVRWRG